MAANLATCPDIVRPHRNLLLRKYRGQFDEELAIYGNMFSGAKGVVTRDSDEFKKKVKERKKALNDDAMCKFEIFKWRTFFSAKWRSACNSCDVSISILSDT